MDSECVLSAPSKSSTPPRIRVAAVTLSFLKAGFMLLFGRILMIARSKLVLLTCVAIFEMGSLICAVSPTIGVLIFGRALAGTGAAGIWVAVMAIIAQVCKSDIAN